MDNDVALNCEQNGVFPKLHSKFSLCCFHVFILKAAP